MSIVVPLTTEIRGGECEVAFEKPFWLKQNSVVNVLGIAGVDNAKIVQRLASFPESKLNEVFAKLARALGVKLLS
jgi:mRNA-degrading endonuclease toxin of MazEF toxin-antitoxin module